MNECVQGESADPQPECAPDFCTVVASLRTAGAEHFDAVGLRYIDALAKRANAHQGSVRHLIDARLEQALAEFSERFDQAQDNAKKIVAKTLSDYPHATDNVQRLFLTGDFKKLQRFAATLKIREQGTSLGALVRQLEQRSAEDTGIRAELHAGPRSELKTLRDFRNTWSKLSVNKKVTQALERAPANAGPINSHMLVLRSLALMRDISPDYLNRFMTYADTLLSLDQGEKDKPDGGKKYPASKAAKK
ncbi:MAG: DUF2894 domain-containing protein [Herminiimonas sp.]|nr:DUF2894 domain-containing protein [Herminiimonas sp.]